MAVFSGISPNGVVGLVSSRRAICLETCPFFERTTTSSVNSPFVRQPRHELRPGQGAGLPSEAGAQVPRLGQAGTLWTDRVAVLQRGPPWDAIDGVGAELLNQRGRPVALGRDLADIETTATREYVAGNARAYDRDEGAGPLAFGRSADLPAPGRCSGSDAVNQLDVSGDETRRWWRRGRRRRRIRRRWWCRCGDGRRCRRCRRCRNRRDLLGYGRRRRDSYRSHDRLRASAGASQCEIPEREHACTDDADQKADCELLGDALWRPRRGLC